ncbi:MAG: Zn-ribbon domain-containing OB-fold protein [Syntrophomonadaceae bacterium]|jgi:uncharacterized OB-fold protein
MPECNQIFWNKLTEDGLYLQQCTDCGQFVFYPRSRCPHCLESELEWKQVSGEGRIYSFTIVYKSALPEFERKTPYIYAVIELAEGVRMPAAVVNCPVDKITVDAPVTFLLTEINGLKLPGFQIQDSQ